MMDKARKVQTGLYQGMQTPRKTLRALRVSSCAFQYILHAAACAESTAHGQWNGIWGRHKPLRRHRNLIRWL